MDKNLKQKLTQILNKNLNLDSYKVFIFGSRASGSSYPFSDIDIGVEGNKVISTTTLNQLEEDFEESDLPFQVDIVDFANVSERFRMNAKRNIIPLN